jgi:hypothetical protein
VVAAARDVMGQGVTYASRQVARTGTVQVYGGEAGVPWIIFREKNSDILCHFKFLAPR